ncbi:MULTISPECIES: nuclease-related domain-containing protein [Allobacillus]|uniref:NERD domain-containing protein n=1 Tax=Allobacillus salarius TaxID=1955272 RepID=A0A556PR10_9BACI|nr:nuclease-related domain-containing protein [Allobacillus salarius]TSJ66821.1 NERD domain-containing protein [Allobacillus salarius]
MSTSKIPHNVPPHVLMLQALYHRIPQSHDQFAYIEKKMNNELAGLYGESRLLYPLSKFPIRKVSLPNIRLSIDSNYFQIDYLILTSKFMLILESKYYSSDLTFDQVAHQVVQRIDEEYKVYDDPVLQVEEQVYQLSNWFNANGFPELPIESFVVMTNPRTRLRIDATNNHHAEKVVSLQRLPSLFRELDAKYEKNIISPRSINEITHKLIQQHKPYLPNILEKNRVSKNELLRGVYCLQCGRLGMKMMQYRWRCPCGYRDRTAHENSLKDYFLLISSEVSNREFREFTGLTSRYTARDILRRNSSELVGKTNVIKHRLSYDYKTDFEYLNVITKFLQTRRKSR